MHWFDQKPEGSGGDQYIPQAEDELIRKTPGGIKTIREPGQYYFTHRQQDIFTGVSQPTTAFESGKKILG